MKLPFDVGVKLIFRLLIPGLVLSLGYLPVLNTVLARMGLTEKFEYAYIPLIVVTGWLIITADMWIYMLFEGRRYWPPGFLWEHYRAKEEQRCKRIQDRIDTYLADKSAGKDISPRRERQYHEDSLDQLTFPINNADKFEARFPTRLGNLLKAYERYPWRIYGMSAVFYWPRLWLLLEKDVREEIDNQQAIADSSIYTVLALYISGGFWFFYAAGSSLYVLITSKFPAAAMYLPASKVTITEHLPHWTLSWALFLILLLLGYGIYRVSLHLHVRVGELVKSTFDDFRDKINVSQVIDEIASITKEASFKSYEQKQKFIAAWRYLQYNLIQCPKCFSVMTPKEYQQHFCQKQPALHQVESARLSTSGAKSS